MISSNCLVNEPLPELSKQLKEIHAAEQGSVWPVSFLLFSPQAALRKLAGVCPEGLQDSDFKQLVQPRLVDSFLLCSNMEESFV